MDSHLLLSIFKSLAFTNAGGKIFSKQKRRRSRGLEERGFVSVAVIGVGLTNTGCLISDNLKKLDR